MYDQIRELLSPEWTMTVRTFPAPTLDMVRYEIETGAVYDFPQVVKAELVGVNLPPKTSLYFLTFQIADDSRGMYERVQVRVPWALIRENQNDTKTNAGVRMMAQRIISEYLASRYVY
jgi:hypothetical protein